MREDRGVLMSAFCLLHPFSFLLPQSPYSLCSTWVSLLYLTFLNLYEVPLLATARRLASTTFLERGFWASMARWQIHGPGPPRPHDRLHTRALSIAPSPRSAETACSIVLASGSLSATPFTPDWLSQGSLVTFQTD